MAFDAFLKIEGIPGESRDTEHPDWIEVLGFSHGMTQGATGHGRTAGDRPVGRCEHQDFTIVKAVDKATPLLARDLCTCRVVKEVKLELCRAGGNKEKYLEYTLTNVIVSSIRPSKTPGYAGGLPVEEVAFGYRKITWTYFQVDAKTGKPKGTLEHQYDLTDNA